MNEPLKHGDWCVQTIRATEHGDALSEFMHNDRCRDARAPSSDLATLRNHEGCRLTVGDFEDYGWALVCESHESGPLIALATPAASSEAAASQGDEWLRPR